jgi:hypothetical protein
MGDDDSRRRRQRFAALLMMDVLGRTSDLALLPAISRTVTAGIEPGLLATVPPIEDDPEAVYEAWRDFLGLPKGERWRKLHGEQVITGKANYAREGVRLTLEGYLYADPGDAA